MPLNSALSWNDVNTTEEENATEVAAIEGSTVQNIFKEVGLLTATTGHYTANNILDIIENDTNNDTRGNNSDRGEVSTTNTDEHGGHMQYFDESNCDSDRDVGITGDDAFNDNADLDHKETGEFDVTVRNVQSQNNDNDTDVTNATGIISDLSDITSNNVVRDDYDAEHNIGGADDYTLILDEYEAESDYEDDNEINDSENGHQSVADYIGKFFRFYFCMLCCKSFTDG